MYASYNCTDCTYEYKMHAMLINTLQEQGYTMTSTLNTKRFTATPHTTIAYKLVRHRYFQVNINYL